MLTFKNMQDEVLAWLDQTDDTGQVLTITKMALNGANVKRSTAMPFSFMVASSNFQLVAGQRDYPLVDAYSSGIYFRNRTTAQYLTEVPWRHVKDTELVTSDTVANNYFTLRRNTITLLWTPSEADAGTYIDYAFYRVPTEMSADTDLPNLPYPYSRILVWDALVELGFYNEDISPEKMALWTGKAEELALSMREAFLEGQTVGAYGEYVRYTDEFDYME